MNFRPHRPSPALVIACIALFVSLGGVSYGFATGSIDGREIRNGTITTKDVRNNEVRGVDIRNSTIGGRDVAFNTLGGNDIKESAMGKVPAASQADSASTLGGVPASGFVRSEAPAFTPLAVSGGWLIPDGEVAPGYDVDSNGYVHLRGAVVRGTGGTITTLPAGARPAGNSRFAVREAAGTGVVTITNAGTVSSTATGSEEVSLDGVTFAAGG